jgi:hypothetical protein
MAQIHHLPLEILEQIFSHVTSHSRSRHLWSSQTRSEIPVAHTPNYLSPASPYSISHVCSWWRKLALDRSSLWTDLCIVEPRKGGIVNLIKEWVKRARDHPLHLSLYSKNSEPSSAITTVVGSFLDVVHQCISFEMEIDTPSIDWDCFPQYTQQPINHLLQFVNVQINKASSAAAAFAFLLSERLLVDSHNLRYIYWTDAGMGFSLRTNRQSWIHLQELHLTTVINSNDNLTNALSVCQSLERLTLRDTRLSSGILLPITLPRLVYLSVSSDRGHHKLINSLTAPSIEELEISGDKDHVLWASITGMLERSRVSLRVLSLRDENNPWARWSPDEGLILEQLSMSCFAALKVLEVEYLSGERTIDFLTLRPNAGHLPHLQRLVLIFKKSEFQEKLPLLSALVNSRLGPKDVLGNCLKVSIKTVQLRLDIPSV